MRRTLPVRLHLKNGSYYYVEKNQWRNLGRSLPEALRIYAGLISTGGERVPELIDRWFAKKQQSDKPLSQSTVNTYRTAMDGLKKAFGEFSAKDVRPAHFYQLVTAKKLTNGMASHYRTVMVNVMQLAVEEGLVDLNPIKSVANYNRTKRIRYIEDWEFKAIYAAATPVLQCMMDIAHITGQRVSDIRKIQISDLREEGIYIMQKKTKHEEIIAWSPDLREVVARARSLHNSVKGFHLFHTRQGGAYSKWTINAWWVRAREKAEVTNVRFHDMRKKAATDAKKAGLDSMALTGHKSEKSHSVYLMDIDVPIVTGNRKVS